MSANFLAEKRNMDCGEEDFEPSSLPHGKERNYGTKKNENRKKSIGKGVESVALTKRDIQMIQMMLDNSVQIILVPINSRLDGMDSRLDGIEIRLDKLESETAALKSGQVEIRKELKEMNRKISDTYDLALEAWGKSTENRTWLEKPFLMES